MPRTAAINRPPQAHRGNVRCVTHTKARGSATLWFLFTLTILLMFGAFAVDMPAISLSAMNCKTPPMQRHSRAPAR